MQPNDVYVRDDNFVPRKVGDATIMVPIENKDDQPVRLCVLENESAQFVINCVDGKRTVSEVAACLAEHYAMSVETAAAKAAESLDVMLKHQLIRLVSPQAASS
jgi:hypothetical protein